MNSMKRPPLKLLVLLVGAALVSSEGVQNDKAQAGTSYRAVSPDDARIIAAISTWTQLSFVTSITTVPLTCNVAVQNTMACKKRRFKKFSLMPQLDSNESALEVDGSLNADARAWPAGDRALRRSDGADDDERSGRLALTVWRSHTSTFTMLMTSTNTAITFSVSFACTIMGASFPPPCG